MKGNLVRFDKTYALLNVLCTVRFCAVVKHFTIPSHCEMNVYLSSYLNVLWLLAWLMRFTGTLLLSKVIRFSRIRWSITSLRLERIILCEIPHLFISYHSCDQFWSFYQIVKFLKKLLLLSFSYKLHHLTMLYVQNSVLTTLFYLGRFSKLTFIINISKYCHFTA